MQRRNKTEQDQFHEVVLHCESLVFISTEIFATVGEVESDSTFRETCLETDQTGESSFFFRSSFLIFPFLVFSYFHALYVFSEDAMRVISFSCIIIFVVLTFILFISVLCPLSQVRSSCTILHCKISASLLFTSHIKLNTLSQSNFHSLHNLCCNLRSLVCCLRLVYVIGDTGVSHPVWITHTCRTTNKMLQPCGQLG